MMQVLLEPVDYREDLNYGKTDAGKGRRTI